MSVSKSNSAWACFRCRRSVKFPAEKCVECNGPMHYMGKRWRAPRKTNDKAWKRIAEGDIWWDKRYMAQKFTKNKFSLHKALLAGRVTHITRFTQKGVNHPEGGDLRI